MFCVQLLYYLTYIPCDTASLTLCDIVSLTGDDVSLADEDEDEEEEITPDREEGIYETIPSSPDDVTAPASQEAAAAPVRPFKPRSLSVTSPKVNIQTEY